MRAHLYQSQGLVLYAEGRLQRAIELHRQALDLFERSLPDSVALGEALNDLGAALRSAGQEQEALVAFQRASRLLEGKLGPGSDLVATSRNGVGSVLLAEGRFEEALQEYRAALAIYEGTVGAAHFRTVTTLNNIGVVFAELGRYAEALPYFTRVLETRRASLGPTSSRVADAHGNVGMLLVELGRLDEAWNHFETARGILQGYPLDHFSQAECQLGFASVHLARGKALLALPPLEKTLGLCEGKEGFRFDYTRARASFLLARALWDSRRGRERALALASQARDGLAGFGRARFARDLRQIEDWLSTRSPTSSTAPIARP